MEAALVTWPPPVLPDSDQSWDEYTDAVSTGDFDDGFLPARLPGRRNHFQNVAATLSRRDPARPSGRLSLASHGAPGGEPLLPSPGPVDPLTSDGVPWSRDAA